MNANTNVIDGIRDDFVLRICGHIFQIDKITAIVQDWKYFKGYLIKRLIRYKIAFFRKR